MTTNVFVRDVDLVRPNADDVRGSKLPRTGCPCSGETSLQWTQHWPLHGGPIVFAGKGPQHDRVTAEAARQRKVQTCPELVGPHGKRSLGCFGA